MKYQSSFMKFIVICFCLLFLIKIANSYEDIKSPSRRQNFLTMVEIKGMLEIVRVEDEISLKSSYFAFKENSTPQSYIKWYFSEHSRRKSINNTIRLLCNSNLDINNFSWEIFNEQSLLTDDRNIIKTVFHRFREIYFIWLASKSLERILNEEELKPIPQICDYVKQKNPSDFFIDHESYLYDINIKELKNSDFSDNIDIVEENRYLSEYGFRLEIKNLIYKEIKNVKLLELNKDNNFLIGSGFVLDFIKLHNNFNYHFSNLHFSMRSKLNINKKSSMNLKYLYTEMTLCSEVYHQMQLISLATLKNSFFTMFSLDLSIDQIFYDMQTIVEEEKQLKLNLYYKENEDQINNLKIDLIYSFPGLLTTEAQHKKQLQKNVERATKLYLGVNVLKDMKKDLFIKDKINLLSTSNHWKALEKNCEFLIPSFLYGNFSKIEYSSDKELIIQDFLMLCYFKLAVKSIEEELKLRANSKIELNETVSNLFNKNKDFSRSIIISNSLNRKFYNIVEKLLPTYYSNNFYNKLKCINLSYEENLLLITSLVYKIKLNLKEHYNLFEMYTANFNEYINNGKFYLNNYLRLTEKEFRTLNFYLTKCKVKSGKTLLEMAYERHTTEELETKLFSIEEMLQNYYNFFNIYDHVKGYKSIEFDTKLTRIRSLFYKFYYNNNVEVITDIDFDDDKKIFSDFDKNREYLFLTERLLEDIMRLLVDRSKFEEKVKKTDL